MKINNKWQWMLRVVAILFTIHCSLFTASAQEEFDPQPPGNPGANYWYSEKGEVVVDDFTTGSLDGALNAVLGDADKGDVLSIVVVGIMNGRDFYAIRSLFYKNCTLVDLSRCTGVTEVPAEAFIESNVETVYLPATIEKIGRYAFSRCENLRTLSVYAQTPPELGDNVFYKVKEDLVIYVPAAALPLYMEADGWKDFTILPIQTGILSLTVSLPEGAGVKDYEGMWLELKNTKNDQSLHYVMTNKRQYIFHNIISNTTWNVTLRSERGDVFGEIKEVKVDNEDVSVAFAELAKAIDVRLKVMTPEGQDVTSQAQVSWTDANGNYLSQTPTVADMPEGAQITYHVALLQDLATTYLTPVPSTVEVSSQLSIVNCQLSILPSAQLSGTVTDAQTGLPLDGATITATQTFGTYTKTLTATTAADGTYALDLSDVPTTVTIAASGYLSQTMVNVNGQWSMLNSSPSRVLSLP